MLKKNICLLLLAGILSSSVAFGQARETTDKDIDVAIKALKSYLWSLQNKDGVWPTPGSYCHRYMLPGGIYATCVATYALLEAGESYANNSKMKMAVDAVAKAKMGNNLRTRALRVMILSRAIGKAKSPYSKILKDDIRWLCKGKGLWGDNGPTKVGDNISNHFALMALWEASMAGVAVPKKIYFQSEKIWARNQNKKDGGWAITCLKKLRSKSTPQMTEAALASMYACRDAASFASGKYRYQKNIDRGWAFMDKKLTEKELLGHVYSQFNVQQAGMASGKKFIGKLDWYSIIANKLAQPRTSFARYSGTHWGHIVTPAFELIILARGRLPLTFNKLDYGAGTSWNYHPRDIARFTEYMRTNFERPMRWQIVNFKDHVATLLDSPIMMVSGKNALELTDAQWDILREYTLRGGTLLFVPVKKGVKYIESVKTKLATLYAKQKKASGTKHYSLKELPKNHPLYSIYQKIKGGKKLMKLSGVSDGTRLLAVVCERDIAESWQRKKIIPGKKDYLMGVNFFLYATGKNSLSSRMRPVFVRKSDKPIIEEVNVSWVKHDGNWNTQPYALEYLHDKVVAENNVGLNIKTGVDISRKALKGTNLVWMTGTDSFSLSGREKTALRSFMKKGGVLFVNAVGGSPKFEDSARRMLDDIFQDDNDVMSSFADMNSPLRTGVCGEYRGPKLEKLARTNAFRKSVLKAPDPIWVYMNKKGKVLAVFVKYGVHDTMDGHTAFDAVSYMPNSSLDIGANVVLYSLIFGKTYR